MYIMQINAILFIELIAITIMYLIDVELFIIFLANWYILVHQCIYFDLRMKWLRHKAH
jgi:hypothetical protein